jgi:chromosome partitioning protein
VPVQPRSFDVWALDQVSALVAEAREINEGLRAVAVLNGADAQGADNEAALEMIGDIEGIEVLPTSIVRRKRSRTRRPRAGRLWSKARATPRRSTSWPLIGAVCISR